jgi:hypothetical protein
MSMRTTSLLWRWVLTAMWGTLSLIDGSISLDLVRIWNDLLQFV